MILAFSFQAASCTPSRHIELDPSKPDQVNPDVPDNNKEELEDGTEFNSNDLVGVDKFGRTFNVISGFKKNHIVGIFYWPWIGQPYASDIYDATKILAMPNGVKILTDPKYLDSKISPDGQAHYWGEPLWGYYNSDDEWVIRKQMQMLTDAGVDFLFFDTTNAVIYANVFLKVCEVIDEMLKEGWDAPKVSFYTHSHSIETVKALYENLYKPNRYPDTWFKIDGKPMIIGYTNREDDLREAASRNDTKYDPGELSSDILNFFHFLKPQWPFDPVYPDGFPWIEWTFPQPLHTESHVMNVTVASHPMCPMSFSLTRQNWTNWGRGWNPSLRQNISEDVDKGTFFQSEWDHAITADPPIISVGGWNEWIAYKQIFDGEYMLCDAACKEYSRDVEPMAGGYEDSFYLQLISNIRRYKGVSVKTPVNNAETDIDIDGGIPQWNKVKYIEKNPDEKYIERDAFGGSKTVHYSQKPPVDKLSEIRVAHDKENIYFLLKGLENFSDYSGKSNWLNIFIGCGEPKLREWECYDYIILKNSDDNSISIQKFENGFSSKEVGKGKFSKKDNYIQIAIPRSSFGSSLSDKFYFKVTMDVETPSDIMNTYKTGSAMPMGRLSYLYRIGSVQ